MSHTGSRESLVKRCEEMEVFLEEVRTRAEDLETLEATGTQFMASAKVHCTSLVYTPSNPT